MLCAHIDTSNNQLMSFGIEKKPGMIAQGKYNLLLGKQNRILVARWSSI